MFVAADIADWWDKQHKTSQKALDDFVDENPSLFGVVVATAVATAMEVGKGTVDVLRFGEGLAEGTAGGLVQDALRAVSLAGPLAKGGKLIKEVAARGRMMKLIVDPGGGRCAYVSAAMALRQTGQKAYASVDDLARELGKPISSLGGATATEIRTFMQALKARLGPVIPFRSWREIENAVPHDGSVLSFGVNFGGKGGHRVFAFRNTFGKVLIMDRGGMGRLPRVVGSLEELAKPYGLGPITGFFEGFVVQDLFLKFLGPAGLPVLAMEVLATTIFDGEKLPEVYESYQQGKKRLVAPDTVITGGFSVEVAAGDPKRSTLSGIAKAQYGDFNLWPLIFDLNRSKIGANPNLLRPGTKLLLLPLERYTPQEIEQARERAPSWRAQAV